jgi:hypothetical protein
VFKPDTNPPVGAYDIDKAKEMVSSRSKAALIREDTSPYRRPKEQLPEPGSYDYHLKPFGSDVKGNPGMGRKYVFKPDSNPPVGAYEAEKAKDAISFRNLQTVIHEDFIKEKRKQVPSPDPGQYDRHLTPFGADVKGNPGMGSKYVFKPDSNPPVGAYDTDKA